MGFELDPHALLQIVCFPMNNTVQKSYEIATSSCEIGLDFTHIRVVSFRIEDLAPFSVILSY